MVKVGVLALQGAFAEHCRALRELGTETVEVRLPGDLAGIDGLVIPGGESTTIGKLMAEYGLLDEVKKLSSRAMPIFGTCAGLIVLARRLADGQQPLVGAMDITIRRNAFGRQLDSFETELNVSALGAAPFHGVFIRAPMIVEAGQGVEVLARLPNNGAVAARQGSILVTAFHPELTGDRRFHQYFLTLIQTGS